MGARKWRCRGSPEESLNNPSKPPPAMTAGMTAYMRQKAWVRVRVRVTVRVRVRVTVRVRVRVTVRVRVKVRVWVWVEAGGGGAARARVRVRACGAGSGRGGSGSGWVPGRAASARAPHPPCRAERPARGWG